MDQTAELLFAYLRNAIYSPKDAQLNPDDLNPVFQVFGKGLKYFVESVTENNTFAGALARGDLRVSPPSSKNEMAAPLKALQSSLRHLTWQTQQVAKGDYSQEVDFMGDFAQSFNAMIGQLDTRQKALLEEIASGREKTRALEQSNALMSVIANSIPQALVVIEEGTEHILFRNKALDTQIQEDMYFLDSMKSAIAGNSEAVAKNERVEFWYSSGENRRCFAITAYPILWGQTKARAYMLNDISEEKAQMLKLEHEAQRDAMTNLYNRAYGMQKLEEWLVAHQQLHVSFIDLNNLKYINDRFGHQQGDHYICCVASHLREMGEDAVISRVGGDEFMILSPGLSEEEAHEKMRRIAARISGEEYIADKTFRYSISYGIVNVPPYNELSASEILRLADYRMYEHKRLLKEKSFAP